MKTGKIVLTLILVLATGGVIYAGYRLWKRSLDKAKDKAIEDYLKNPTETNKQAVLDNNGTLPDATITSQSITWVSNDDFPLKKGHFATAEGSNIKRLQTALKNKWSHTEVDSDGYFGNITETALKNSNIILKTQGEVTETELKDIEDGVVTQPTTTTTPTTTNLNKKYVLLRVAAFSGIIPVVYAPLRKEPNKDALVITNLGAGSLCGIAEATKYDAANDESYVRVLYWDGKQQAYTPAYVWKDYVTISVRGSWGDVTDSYK